MPHEHGDVPGPTTKGGERPDNSAQPGEHAAEGQASPPAPLGYGEAASENLGTTGATPNPSVAESATHPSAPNRGGGHLLIPGEDS